MATTKTKATKKATKVTKVTEVSIPKKATKEDPELQGKLKDFISQNLEGMMEDFKDLTPTKKWDYIIQLLPYATPKMQAIDNTVGGGGDPLQLQLSQLTSSLIKND